MKRIVLLILIIIIATTANNTKKDEVINECNSKVGYYDSETDLYYLNVKDWGTGKKEVLVLDCSEEAQKEVADWERSVMGVIVEVKE